MKRLSIIIPMYNVEPYVERCIRSLEDQDISKDDYEILCINDGSPDDSRGVVMALQNEFKNVILIDQNNQGVSRARNNGLDRATGKYVMFIDPDDYVVSNTLSEILSYTKKYDAEVCFLGYRFINQDGTVKEEILNDKEQNKIFFGILASDLSRGDGKVDPDRMWAILFRRSFLNKHNLRYLPDVPYLEDGELISRILCLAKKCVFWGKLFYLRTTRPGSATRSKLFHTKKATDGFIKSAVNLKNFKEYDLLNDEQIGYINKKIVKFIVLSVSSLFHIKSIHRLFYVRNQLKRNNLLMIDLNGVSKSYIKCGERINKSFLAILIFLVVKKIEAKFVRKLRSVS